MTKVVFNGCYGGFSLSEKAVLRYAELAGFALYPAPLELGGKSFASLGNTYWKQPPSPDLTFSDETVFNPRDIARTDPLLHQVIDELGSEADGRCSSLQVRDLEPGTRYRIDEYDGFESVVTVDEYEWSVA